MKKIIILLAGLLVFAGVNAELVSVSQGGYHPQGTKQVVVYTTANSGTFELRDSGGVVLTRSLEKAKDFDGNSVECQGNSPCFVGDFTDFTVPGTYTIAALGVTSPQFKISSSVYQDNIPTLLEFFNAQLQQGSSYHADMHSGYTPAFTSIADGSFIMEAEQASLSLIRLGSAYRRNPRFFQGDRYAIFASGKSDMQEYIRSYVLYLEGLQGVAVQERTDGVGFRLSTGMKINNAFVPGPVNLTGLDVYIPGNPPQFLERVPVLSLCGAEDGSAAWQNCIDDAALYYKCQIDEPCLNITYIDRTGVANSNPDNFGVSKGWGYEFGCYFDNDFSQQLFNSVPDPCTVFYPQASRQDTVKALLGFLEAVPAMHDYSASEGSALVQRSISTYNFIKSNYGVINSEPDASFFGAGLFLLYDYTENAAYLQEAHGLRGAVSSTFISDHTRGNEFYWEEYVRHRSAIEGAGLSYQLNGQNPEEFFRGKIFNDYKDIGATSMGRNGERVFQFDNNIQFQNSRYILTEGVLASKTIDLSRQNDSFVKVVADNQLAWVTGMNGVQDGTGIGAPLKSVSFIFGIGNFPSQFHSRYLVDTGYTVASGGKVIGARGTGYQFLNTVTSSVTPSTASPEDYVYLDGTFNILGKQLGALGNSWRGEDPADIFRLGRQFNNGKNHIPGWINGAFDTVSDPDVIFNYADTLSTYEFTESTNEMVATAIELHAYRDAQLGGAQVQFPQGVLNMTNDTTSNGSGIVIEANSTNSSNASANETNNSSINQTNSTVDSNSSNSSSPFLNVTIPELNTSSSQANATPALNQTNSTIPLNNTTNATTDTANTTSASNQTSESTGSSSGGGSGSGGGGGGSSGSKQGSQNKESERNKFGANRDQIYGVTMFETQNFEVVYAVLGRDKINSTQVQNITLDAKVSSGNITRAEAVFLNSLGEYRAENLTLIAGTGSYGTWSADFGGFANGLQQLEVVRLWGRSASPAEIRIPNRAFYVTDGNETFEENHLRLVYTTLDASNLEPGQNATLRIDAGDNGGITGVAAKIESSRGGSFNLSLQRVRGNQFYGTWEEVIVANQSDSTYVVTQITLFNATDEKNYTIEGRSVYVAAVPPAIGKLASRAVETVKVFSRRWVLQVIQKPLVPTLIAFGIMTIAISLLLAGGKIRRWMGKVTA